MSNETGGQAFPWAIAAKMLHEYADRLSNDGCNDYELPATLESRALVTAMYQAGMSEEDAVEQISFLEHTESLGIHNDQLADYLASLADSMIAERAGKE